MKRLHENPRLHKLVHRLLVNKSLKKAREGVEESRENKRDSDSRRVMLEAAESTIALLDDEDFAAGVARNKQVLAVLVECEADGAEATWRCKDEIH